LPNPILEIHPICICLLDVSAAIFTPGDSLLHLFTRRICRYFHAWRHSPTSVYSPCLQLFFTPRDSLLPLFTLVSAAILHAWRHSPTSIYSPCLQLFFTPGGSPLHLFTRRVCSYSSRLESLLHLFTRRVCSYSSCLETFSYICLLAVSAVILHAWRQSPTSVYSPRLQLFFTPGDSLLHLFTSRVCSYSSRLETVSYICLLAVSTAILHAWKHSPTSVY